MIMCLSCFSGQLKNSSDLPNVIASHECLIGSCFQNLADSEGRTPLHWAVDRGRVNVTALLLKKNADVNAKVGGHLLFLLIRVISYAKLD